MAKRATVYLNDERAAKLAGICEEEICTPSQALTRLLDEYSPSSTRVDLTEEGLGSDEKEELVSEPSITGKPTASVAIKDAKDYKSDAPVRVLDLRNENVRPLVSGAIHEHSSILGVDVVTAAEQIGRTRKWDELSDDDRLFLLMNLRGDAGDLERIAGFLSADPADVRVFFDRIVQTGPKSDDLRVEA